MAITGPDYECLYAKIGSNCMVHDGGVWSKIRLLQPIDGSVKLQIHDKLTESDQATLIVFLDDDEFTLKLYMIKAYPQQNLTLNKIVYSYDDNRAWRRSEDLFGNFAKDGNYNSPQFL